MLNKAIAITTIIAALVYGDLDGTVLQAKILPALFAVAAAYLLGVLCSILAVFFDERGGAAILLYGV